MESSSPFSAVCEVFGLYYILNIFGVFKVVTEAAAEVKEDMSFNSGVTAEVTVEQKGTAAEVVEQEVMVERAVEKEVIADLLVQKKENKSKKTC